RRHTRSKRDWSSDVCSSDLARVLRGIITFNFVIIPPPFLGPGLFFSRLLSSWFLGRVEFRNAVNHRQEVISVQTGPPDQNPINKIGRASCRERGQTAVGRLR